MSSSEVQFVEIKSLGYKLNRREYADLNSIYQVSEIGLDPVTLRKRLANGTLEARTKADYEAFKKGEYEPKKAEIPHSPLQREYTKKKHSDKRLESKDFKKHRRDHGQAETRMDLTIDEYWTANLPRKSSKQAKCPHCGTRYGDKFDLFDCCSDKDGTEEDTLEELED